MPLPPEPEFEPLIFQHRPPEEALARARAFYQQMQTRRTIRQFSSETVPQELIELLILTAGTAPSGAHRQPWRFVAVQDMGLKRQIRQAAEANEQQTYRQMPDEWRSALAPLGTDAVKTHLTDAPWLIAVFREKFGVRPDGSHIKNYYTAESTAIAAGLLIAAIHHAGLVTLTHTPSPLGFLGELLARPRNEEAMLLLPVGYPAANAEVPKLRRKTLADIFQIDKGHLNASQIGGGEA